MARVYNPDGTQPYAVGGLNAAVFLASIAGGSPPTVSTVTSTAWQTGDTVELENTGVTAYDGLHTITVTGPKSFQINGASGASTTYTGSTAIATDYSVNPLIQLPSDGQQLYSSTFNAPIEGIDNTVPFLYRGLGAYRTIWEAQASSNSINPLNLPVGTWGTTSCSSTGPGVVVNGASYLAFNLQFFGANIQSPFAFRSTDILEYDVTFQGGASPNATYIYAVPANIANIASPTFTLSPLFSTPVYLANVDSNAGAHEQHSLRMFVPGSVYVGAGNPPLPASTVDVALFIQCTGGVGDSGVILVGNYEVHIRHLRKN